jgi:mRNA-degrading endonuclease RelE of RelBE toxin-antitoxin system
MGTGKKTTAYHIKVSPGTTQTLKGLDKQIVKRIDKKLEWLSKNHDQIQHETLSHLPKDLVGLRKYRVGDYRILYISHLEKRLIEVHAIIHRSSEYRILERR